MSKQELIWSFEALFAGTHPSTDSSGADFPVGSPERARAGQALAGGFRGVLWVLRGDLDFFSNSLGLEHFHSNTPCFLCRANQSDVPWTDPRPNAAWRSTTWGKDDWRAAHPNPHPVFSIPGVSIFNVAADLMHSKHLGTDQHFYGSVCKLLTHEVMAGSRTDNEAQLWAELEQQYQDLKVVNRPLVIYCLLWEIHCLLTGR